MIKRIPKNDLQIDNNLMRLFEREEGTLTEIDFREELKRYNLRDCLITIGCLSFSMFWNKDEKFGHAGYRDPRNGSFMTQFALAYLGNISLVSGSNDYKAMMLSKKNDNVLALSNVYGRLQDKAFDNPDEMYSYFLRTETEQLEFQRNPHYIMARAIVIFTDIIEETPPSKFEPLSHIFQTETGLTIKEYFIIAFALMVSAYNTAIIHQSILIEADFLKFPLAKDILTEEKIARCLNILKADYSKFRKVDNERNKTLNPIYTKTRFNPLNISPIIETQNELANSYVIPNAFVYFRRVYEGTYWWFDARYSTDFRGYFGKVFERYVGRILEGIYGKENVRGEIKYKREGSGAKSPDWWVERDGKIYLFEAKAYQLALQSKQTGEKEKVLKDEIRKIAEAIEQVYQRVQDIETHEELKVFRGKQIIPVIVFMLMPLYFIDSWLNQALEKIESEKQLVGLREFSASVLLMNIDELEDYDGGADVIGLEEVFNKLKENSHENFGAIVVQATGKDYGNRYLKEVKDSFFNTWGLNIRSNS